MAEDDAKDLAGPWDDQTELFVDDLDGAIQKKYSVSFRTLILRPDQLAGNKEVSGNLSNIKKEVNAYFDQVLDDFKEEKKKLEADLETMDANFKKIDEAIKTRSSIARVPYIKPLVVDYDPNRQEEVIIDQYNASVDSLIGKLISSSTFISNISTPYKGHSMGSWIFSGDREYIITLNPPVSAVITIENSRDLLNTLVDGASARLAP
ncbi:MAG: hypothetical protein KGH72_05045 [Candidatus Micrarchaeota archaeon]|nr:hypothetical protein [Candidatus Micrarchaeota archaeon]